MTLILIQFTKYSHTSYDINTFDHVKMHEIRYFITDNNKIATSQTHTLSITMQK